jgi:hypothetical protein
VAWASQPVGWLTLTGRVGRKDVDMGAIEPRQHDDVADDLLIRQPGTRLGRRAPRRRWRPYTARLVALTLRILGLVARSQGDHTRATEYFRECITEARLNAFSPNEADASWQRGSLTSDAPEEASGGPRHPTGFTRDL